MCPYIMLLTFIRALALKLLVFFTVLQSAWIHLTDFLKSWATLNCGFPSEVQLTKIELFCNCYSCDNEELFHVVQPISTSLCIFYLHINFSWCLFKVTQDKGTYIYVGGEIKNESWEN